MRLAIRIAFRLLLLWWHLRRPRHDGALVALWHDGRVLLVRSSYRRQWSLPGGSIRRDEMPRDAARRELGEELGLAAPALRFAGVEAHLWEHRWDRTILFEAMLAAAPRPRPDNREVLEAIFLPPAQAMALELTPQVRAYLTRRLSSPSSASTPAAAI